MHFYCALLSIGLLSIGLLSLRLYGIRISTHTHMHTYTHAHAHPHNNYASQLAAHTYNYASQLAAHTYNWFILGSPKCFQNRFNHQTNLQTSLVDSCMFCFVLVWGWRFYPSLPSTRGKNRQEWILDLGLKGLRKSFFGTLSGHVSSLNRTKNALDRVQTLPKRCEGIILHDRGWRSTAFEPSK